MDTVDSSNNEQADRQRVVSVGKVVDIKDDKHLGRVQVELDNRAATDNTRWASVATLMAGPDRGTYFLPEVGDKVLVAFADGDIEQPYVVGTLWVEGQKPPRRNDPKNPVRQIKSRAGHTLTFDDTKNTGKVTIETKKGQKVVLDDEAEEVTVEDANGNEIKTSKDGISVESDKRVRIKGKSVEIEADEGVDVSGSNVDLTASSKMALASRAGLDIDVAARTTLNSGTLGIKSAGLVRVQGTLIMLN